MTYASRLALIAQILTPFQIPLFNANTTMRPCEAFVALIALPSLAFAVTLRDFTPRVDDLPEKCNTVYTQDITGCSDTDFTTGTCSTSCVRGLNAIAFSIEGACGSLDLEGVSVLSAFIEGKGPSSLCPNADEVLAGGSGSEADTTSAQSTAQQSPTDAHTTSAPKATIVSSTSIANSAPQSFSSLLVDTRRTVETTTESTTTTRLSAPIYSDTTLELSGTTAVSATASAEIGTTLMTQPAQTSNAQTDILLDSSPVPSTITSTIGAPPSSTDSSDSDDSSNGNSGGGSPFDTQNNPGENGAGSMASTVSTYLVGLPLALLLAAL